MKISQAQADALGGCKECEPATTPKVTGSAAPIPSVLVVDPSKPDWIAIELRTPKGKPIPLEPFALELGDGTRIVGKLDNLGRIRVEGVDPGTCQVTFPDRDGKEWKKH